VSLSLRYAARTDVGLIREGNEDALYAGPQLLAVADGMGGHAAGEVASRIVIETLAQLDASPPDGDLRAAMRRAVEAANSYLRDMVAADSALEGMGTTLTALLWVRQTLGLVHIGDSRAYLLRDGRLEQVTHDHTWVQTLIDQGRISPDEANTHPQRSWITNALDGREDIELDLSIRDVRVGDRYLVCSDGLSSYVSEPTMEEALHADDPQGACDRLVDLALRAGGLDNVTCIVADIVDQADAAGGPIVGGAAAGGQAIQADEDRTDSPAARAAAIRPRPSAPASDPAPKTVDDEPATLRPRGSRRLALVLIGIAVLVIAGALGTFFYIRTLYYVGVAKGTTATVGVYRGVQGSVIGLDLDSLTDRSNLPVTALSADERDRVGAGIPADSHADAQRIVAALRDDACARATATPRPVASPSPAPTRTGSHRRHANAKPTPSVSPSPPPAYCTATP
jgi:PPM family protein phosphatase